MTKLKKYGLVIFFVLLILIQTSCVKRRISYLEREKLARENAGIKAVAHTGIFIRKILRIFP